MKPNAIKVVLAGLFLLTFGLTQANFIINPDFDLDANGDVNMAGRAIGDVLAWEGTGFTNVVVPTAVGAPVPPNGKDISGRISYNHWDAQIWQNTGHIIQPNTRYVLSFDSYPLTYVWGLYLEVRAADGSGNLFTTNAVLDNSSGRGWKTHEYIINTLADLGALAGKELQIRLRIVQEGDGGRVMVTNFNLGFQIAANTPTPADGATNAGVLSEQPGKADVLLTWQPGLNPVNPEEPYPLIRDYYLYLSEDQTTSTDPNLYYIDMIDSGYPDIDELSQYGPLELNLDGAYLWRVDTGVALDGGGVSGPNDPNTIVGSVWAFETLSSVPIITAQPASMLLGAVGESAAFSFTASTVSPGQYQWYRADVMPVYDPVTNAMVPAGSPAGIMGMIFPPGGADTLTLSNVQFEDQGFYYCKVWNEAGQDEAVYTNIARLGIKQQMAHWTLDGLVNDQYADQTGNFHADPNNPALVQFVDGIRNNAVRVDENSFAWVDAALDPTLYTNQITISAWIRVTGQLRNTDGQGIVSKRDDGGSDQWRWSLYARGRDGDWVNSVRFQTWNGGNAWSNPNSVPQGEWAHVAAVVDGNGTGRVYVNGVQNGNTQSNWNWGPNADAPVLLGRYRPTGPLFPGEIDDVQIWNYGKDKYQIADLYYAETGISVCSDPLPAGIAVFDYNEDCRVDILDFVEFASGWLDCGLYPDCL